MLARAVSADREVGDDRIALRLAHRADRVETNGVTGDLERVSRRESPLRVDGPRLARRHRERDENDPKVHDVTAVAAPVSTEQVRERRERGFAVERAPRAHAAREFLHDRREDECAERIREHGGECARPGHKRGKRAKSRRHDRCRELALERRA